jgi:hypothetical protein
MVAMKNLKLTISSSSKIPSGKLISRGKLPLEIELVPSSAWQNNLRHILTKKMWDDIRKKVYAKNDGKCAICGKVPQKLHAHEVWEYDDKNHTQILKDIIPVCTMCHLVKHIGFAGINESRGGAPMVAVIAHFCRVNNVDRTVFQKHYEEELEKYEERSRYEWIMDLGKYKERVTR